MKSINDLINENKEEQIDEGLAEFARIGIEIALLGGVVAMFAKSFKNIAEGENGFIEVIKTLRQDAKVSKICRKLAKDNDVVELAMNGKNVKADEWRNLISSKLNDKESQYLFSVTQERVEDCIKK